MQLLLSLISFIACVGASQKHVHSPAIEARDVYYTTTTFQAVVETDYNLAPGNGAPSEVLYGDSPLGEAPASSSLVPQSSYEEPTTTLSASTLYGAWSSSSSPASIEPSASSTSSSSSSSASSSASSNSTSGLGKYSSALGIAFSQYDASGNCKSEETLAANFAEMAGYNVVRLYNTDCDLISCALKYKSQGQKLFIGIYDPTKISEGVSAIENAFKSVSGASFDDVYAVSVGNEHVNDGKFTASQMVSYLQQAKEALNNIGYSGDVTIVDTFNAIQANDILCTNEHISFVAANAHPFFSGVDSLSAGSWVKSTIGDLKKACNQKVLITETGWPSKGSNIGSSRPSVEDQSTALSSTINEAAESIILFSAWNEGWKQPGEYGVEPYWGINNYDG